jgi:hypothetical protein
VLVVLKSGSINLLEPSGPVKACNGIALLIFIDFKGDAFRTTHRLIVLSEIKQHLYVRKLLSELAVCARLYE